MAMSNEAVPVEIVMGGDANSIAVSNATSIHADATNSTEVVSGAAPEEPSVRRDSDSTFVFHEKRNDIKKKKELVQDPVTILYVVYRYKITKYMTWVQYFRHYVPYPLCLAVSWAMQAVCLYLMEDQHGGIGNHGFGSHMLEARLIALFMLLVYVMMAGRNTYDLIRCISYDAVTSKNKVFWLYLLLPITQSLIHIAALAISADIVLESITIVDIFKDAVAIMFILEIDDWFAAALNKRYLGLEEEMFVIDFKEKDNNSNVDKIVTGITYGLISLGKLLVLIWDVYHEIDYSLYRIPTTDCIGCE